MVPQNVLQTITVINCIFVFLKIKTEFNPIKVNLKLFFKWGVQFEDKPFVVPLRDNQNIKYANKDDLMTAAHEKYQKPAVKDDEEIPPNSYAVEQTEHEQNYPESEKNARRPQDVKIHRADTTETNA